MIGQIKKLDHSVWIQGFEKAWILQGSLLSN